MSGEKDDFDKDITEGADGLNQDGLVLERMDVLILAFAELHESFRAMIEVGFTEAQALKFLAYLSSIIDGDI